MGKIVILDELTTNKIAAGEVIERPSSVVKELVENAIDAEATAITVEIKKGGIAYLKITDNGIGMEEDDAEIAFERHATSKIRNAGDLDSIATLGFRGEALASIAAVSTVELTTRMKNHAQGMYVLVQGGTVRDVRPVGCPAGTTFVVRDLFFNTPARFKFLKKDTTEAGYISDILERIALAKPHISFRFINNGGTVLHTPGNNDLQSIIFSIYGKEIARQVVKLEYKDEKMKILGYAGKPEIARSNRNQQTLFVNGRYIKSKVLTAAIDEAYKTLLMKNKFAFTVLHIEINPLLVDVNVHPTKMEVRFADEQHIFRSVYNAIQGALLSQSLIRDFELPAREKELFHFPEQKLQKEDFEQQHIAAPASKSFSAEQENARLQRAEQQVEQHDVQISPKPIPKPENPEPMYQKHGLASHTIIPEPPKSSIAVNAKDCVTNIHSQLAMEYPTAYLMDETVGKPDKVAEAHIGQAASDLVFNFLQQARIIGQVFSTYILLQYENDMIFIDQHAAHERIVYEKLKHRLESKVEMAQMLLAPAVVELTPQELGRVEEHKDFLHRIGFNFENFGNHSIIIRAIPVTEDNAFAKALFLDVLDYLSGSRNTDYSMLEDEAVFQIACKAAIKANKLLDDREIRNIILELSKLENPYSCPHGRPTIIKTTKYELEKRFHRII